MMRSESPKTKAKTSRRKMARRIRIRINKRKIGVTSPLSRERVLSPNKEKNNQSLMQAISYAMGLTEQETTLNVRNLMSWLLKMTKGRSDEEVPNRVNPLQLLNVLSVRGTFKGLSYVQVEINGNRAKAMLNTGTTHNFVAD